MTPSVHLKNVDIQYPLSKHGSLKQALVGGRTWDAQPQRWKPALRDISLKIDAPQKIGIIGRNASGKTTLLQVIAGILPPQSGNRHVIGKIAAIIAAGVGFDTALSVRENVRFAMAMSGRLHECTEDYIRKILDFIELQGDGWQPLQTLSLGFQSRLAFAVGLFQTPEIFLLDEAFSAGDALFVRKARAAMKERMASSPISIFVSHVESELIETCERGVWLEDGRIVADGPIDQVLKDYGKMNS